MRITKVSVKGLFGMFDHEIPLESGVSDYDHVHGPNGVGKTVSNGGWYHGLLSLAIMSTLLVSIPFDQLCITLSSSLTKVVAREGNWKTKLTVPRLSTLTMRVVPLRLARENSLH